MSTSPDTVQCRFRPDRLAAGMLATAWRQMVFGQARAVLALLDVGFQVEPQAKARVCIEHAVALEELALAADSGELEALLERMAGDVGRRQGWQLDSLDRLDADAGGTNRSLLDAARENQEILMPPGQLRRIRDMFERVSPGGALYSVYSRLSEGSTHAGLGSAAPYLESAVRAGTAPDAVPWAETAALLCWSCCAAEDAMLRFIEDGVDRAARQVEPLACVGIAPG